jgi:nicotinate-nucleotide adenylyltransferase
MRIGVFGGSFDPIHQGHLILAEQCREQAGLDAVWFVPCALSPDKERGAQGTDRQRIEMIELAIAGHPAFQLARIEIDRGGVSYTVDTLKAIRELHADDELFLLLGADSLDNFDTWREPSEICQLAIPLVVGRPNAKEVDLSVLKKYVDSQRYESFCRHSIVSPLIDIQSRQIRKKIEKQQSIRYLTPRAVEKYIETQKLYCQK